MRPHHLGDDACHLGIVIHIVLAIFIFGKGIHLLCPWSLFLLVARTFVLHRVQRRCVGTPRTEPTEDVRVQSSPILRFRSIPPILKNPERCQLVSDHEFSFHVMNASLKTQHVF